MFKRLKDLAEDYIKTRDEIKEAVEELREDYKQKSEQIDRILNTVEKLTANVDSILDNYAKVWEYLVNLVPRVEKLEEKKWFKFW